jgi:RNA polymerase sigma factor (sigma-70 family)
MFDDDYLIKRCIHKDRKCQRLLYEKYSSLMLGVCRRYSDTREEAEDILQDGFVKAFMNIGQFSGKGSFKSWLKSIMINTAVNHFHSNKKYRNNTSIENMGDDMIRDNDSVSGLVRLNEEDLMKVITDLPPGFRMIFNLHAIEGYKHNEIAQMLNIEEGTSKSQYSRARKMIMDKLMVLEQGRVA